MSPRVNVSASSSTNKVITTTSHGGKVTFHVTTNAAPSNGQNTILKKPAPPSRTNTAVKPSGAPPVPPNKPVVAPKKDGATPAPLSVEVKPHKVGPQTVKFGITISKTSEGTISPEVGRRDAAQVEEPPRVHACVDSLSNELDNFHQLLTSMAGNLTRAKPNVIPRLR